MAKFLKFWLPVTAWAVFIFYLSSIPDLKSSFEFDFILRKISHVVEYFILAWLLYRAFAGSFDNINIPRLFIYPTAISFLYAISDELHQSFVPSRNCSILDLLIDAMGILIFYIINIFVFRRKRRILI
ncbi:MAG: VanZ family protein [Candidatus Omnitrophica bacterium]|nr:VanZ family protein [Candidatus Omnitrophota bacterium]MDD5690743.1 VanZ family protein [Candidatus Omnitrophota bacterium]